MPDEVKPVEMMSAWELENQLAELKKKNDELSHALYKQSASHVSRAVLIQTIYRTAFFSQNLPFMALIENYASECNMEIPDFLGAGKENRFDPQVLVGMALFADDQKREPEVIGKDASVALRNVLNKFTEG